MNGIHAVVLATGNDTRGAEASAHAYASRDEQYRGIATWKFDKERGRLVGTIEVPMTLAIVGGGTKVLPIAKASLELLNVQSAAHMKNEFPNRDVLMSILSNHADLSSTSSR